MITGSKGQFLSNITLNISIITADHESDWQLRIQAEYGDEQVDAGQDDC